MSLIALVDRPIRGLYFASCLEKIHRILHDDSFEFQHLDALLRHVSDIVDKHTDSEVLENASKVLENLCNEGYSISGKCNVAKSTLIDNLVQKYKVSFQDFFQEVNTRNNYNICIRIHYPSFVTLFKFEYWICSPYVREKSQMKMTLMR